MLKDCELPVEIRYAVYEDVQSITEITREAFTEYKKRSGAERLDALEETTEDIRNDINTKLVFIALSDGCPAGSVRVELKDNGTAYLTRFGVKKDKRYNGIGRKIIDYVDEIMKEKNVKHIYLYTGADMTFLMRFYADKGFHVESIDFSRGYARAKLVKDY